MQTKYTMLVIPPVLIWYGLVHARIRLAAAATVVAVGAFAGWELLLVQQYGRSHFVHHASSGDSRRPGQTRAGSRGF